MSTLPFKRRPILPAGSGLGLVGALVLALSGCGSSASPPPSSSQLQSAGIEGQSGFDGAALPGAPPAPSFTLTDQSGKRVSLTDYRGRVVVLAFLYPTCGATCVLIAQQIRGALDELAHPPAVLIVSADPSADTPSRVRGFLQGVSLEGRAQYLTGSEESLRPVWSAYGVRPASAGVKAFATYASVLLVDPRGRRRVLFGSEQLTPEALAHDVRKLEGDPVHP